MKLYSAIAALSFAIAAYASSADDAIQDQSQTTTSNDQPTVSQSERIKERARAIYGRGKANIINRTTYYLADYGMSLKAIAMLFGQPVANKTGGVNMNVDEFGQPVPMPTATPVSNSTLSEVDRAVLLEAIRAFMKPLRTYQQAQQQEDPEKLSGSLVGVMDILLRKAQASDGAASDPDSSQPKIEEDDYQTGQLWTTVVRKEDVNAVISARDSLFAAAKPSSPATPAKQEDQKRLTKIRDYYAMLNGVDTKFTKLISKKLDWKKFEARYVEVVERVLLKRPDLVKRCRVYLAKYLSTGDANEGYFNTLVAEANKQAQTAGANAIAFNSLLTAVPLVLAALVLVL